MTSTVAGSASEECAAYAMRSQRYVRGCVGQGYEEDGFLRIAKSTKNVRERAVLYIQRMMRVMMFGCQYREESVCWVRFL